MQVGIAYFVVNGWSDPIILNHDERTIIDGLHRLKAAMYLGMDTIEVAIRPIVCRSVIYLPSTQVVPFRRIGA
jgi:ParB-like nuclease domain